MNKDEQTISVKDHAGLKMKMLNWANRFNIFCFTDDNNYAAEGNSFSGLLAVGSLRSFSFPEKHAFEKLQIFFDEKPSFLFGHIGYNGAGNAYKNPAKAEVSFGRGFFFEPQMLLQFHKGVLRVLKSDVPAQQVISEILSEPSAKVMTAGLLSVENISSKTEYLKGFENISQHIQRGDCYEINFCRGFRGSGAVADPVRLYLELCEISPAPFAALYKLENKYCVCSSPERFLKKNDLQILSQPIKGTARRDLENAQRDRAAARRLASSEKDRAENVMIVDLVRNDLSMAGEKGSVKVTELFGVHSFPQVHHLISTVECTLRHDLKFTDAIKACFPPGSMTGAPKKRVMEIIEKEEPFARGLFSGSIGYITPGGDFDFNVVIRSLFADTKKEKLCFFAGGGITAASRAEEEFDECDAKAEAILKLLKRHISG